MKKIVLATLLTLSLQAVEFHDQQDKQIHFTASALISALSTEVFIHKGYSQTESILYGIGISLLVGIAKEAYDEYSYGGADIQDIKADALGAIGGVTPRLIYNWEF